MGEERLRLAIVQTSYRVTSEVQVLFGLLESLHQLAQERQVPPVEVLLLQGIDKRAGPQSGRQAARHFAQLPNVTIHEIAAGKLGQQDTPLRERAMKVRDLITLLRSREQSVAAARAFQPDLVYSNQQIWDLRIATRLAHVLRRPQIIHLHYIVGPWLGRHSITRLKEADMVLCVSDFIRQDAIDKGVQPDRAYSLYNSMAVPPEPPPRVRAEIKRRFCAELSIPDDSFLVGMTARLNPYKGQEELTQAMLPIMDSDPRVHLVLAGSENPAGAGVPERILKMAERQGVQSQVHLLGQRSDVARILDALDLFAHPSRYDPCPLAVLEAAAHGLPMVAWREGGIASLVLDQETGLLVEPMDVEALSQALRTLIADDRLRIRMGQRARERTATDFRPDLAAASFFDLLSALRNHASPAGFHHLARVRSNLE